MGVSGISVDVNKTLILANLRNKELQSIAP
jgi:hypothetical protein